MLLGVLVIAAMALAAQTAVAAPSPSQQWMTSAGPEITAAGGTMDIAFGATGVTGVLTGVSNTCNGRAFPPYDPVGCWAGGSLAGAFDGPTIPPYLEPDPPAGMPAINGSLCCSAASGPYGQTTVHTWAFNKPVIAPILHVVNLGASYLDISGTTTAGAPITLSALSMNPAMEQNGNRLNQGVVNDFIYECSLPGGATPTQSACGSFQLGGGLVQDFTMTNVLGQVDQAGDGWYWAMSFPTAPLTKQFSPDRIPVNGTSQLTFTIANPANPAQADLSPLDFTDVLPANVRLAPGAPANNGSCGTPTVALVGDNEVRATNVSVAAGETCTITVNVTSSVPTEPGPPYVNNNTNLSTSVANLIPGANTTLAVYPVADMKIVKSSDGPVVPGEQETYELLVTNDGPSTATNEVVTDDLPSGMSFVSASPGCTEAGGTVSCAIASLPANESVTFTVTADVAASADCEDLVQTASVSGNTADPNMGNNSSTVRNCEVQSDLRVAKDPSSAQVSSGGQVMYTVVVENLGPSDNPNVMVSDPMAAGLSLVSADPSQGTCSTAGGRVACALGDLAAGGSAQIVVTATVTAPAGASCEATRITNTATATGDAFDPNPDNSRDSAEICVPPDPQPQPFDLAVSKSVNDRTVFVGQRVTYRVVARNNGPAAAPGVTMTDTINAPVSVVSVRSTQGSCEREIPMRCELGTIAAGASVTITIVAKHREATGCSPRQRQAASATGAGTDSNPANNMDTVDVCVAKIKLKLSKVANRSTVRGGEAFSYRIRVRNPTRGEARNVRVCDRLPSGLRYLSSTPRARTSGRQKCWTIRRLGARKSRTFQVTVRAANGASGRKTNTATATSPDTRRVRGTDAVRVTPRPDRPTG